MLIAASLSPLPFAVTLACVFYFLAKRLEFPGPALKAAPTNDPKTVVENTSAQSGVQRCFNHSDDGVHISRLLLLPSFLHLAPLPSSALESSSMSASETAYVAE